MLAIGNSGYRNGLFRSESRHHRRRHHGETEEDKQRRRKTRVVDDEDQKHESAKLRPRTSSRAAESQVKANGSAERRQRRSTLGQQEKSRVGTTSKSKAQGTARNSTTSMASPRTSSSSAARPKSTLKEKRTSSIIPRSTIPKAKEATKDASAKQTTTDGKRGSSSLFLSTLFGTPQLPTEKMITCLTCLSDDVPISRSAKLSCSHRMCYKCLKRIFTMSVSDPQHMPPRCCTNEHIPLKHVDKLFDTKFKTTWNKKYQEYTTKNRIYCPSRGCGEWIKPNHIFIDNTNGGRKYGKCSKCKAKVCALCNQKWHRKKDCPKDEDANKFNEIAKEAGWKRCYNCSAMVELKEGCNHMTCRCTAEFCIICGLKWKTCECPWFNYGTMDDGDMLGNMDLPAARRIYGQGNEDARAPIRYQQEVDRRQEQERQDEVLAQRLQRILSLDDDDDNDAGYNYQNHGHTPNPGGNDMDDAFPAIEEHFFIATRMAGAHTPPPPVELLSPSNRPPDDPAPQYSGTRTRTPESTRRRRRRKQAMVLDPSRLPSSTSRVEQWRRGLQILSR